MACNVTIDGVFGLDKPWRTRVIGTVGDCPANIEGDRVLVSLSCEAPDSPFAEQSATVDHDGNWEAVFQDPPCGCGEPLFITATCASDPTCAAEPFAGVLVCVDCPDVNFFGSDDVGLTDFTIDCDTDGTAVVTLKFEVFNTTTSDLVVHVNCGPGGSPVSGNDTPIGAGASAVITAQCRYDPTLTTSADPFIEFQNTDGSPQGCSPVPFPVGQLPECTGCPTSIHVEVKDAQGTVVTPELIHCLEPDTYTLVVTFPTVSPEITIGWSIASQITPEVGPEFDVTLSEGQEVTVTASASKTGCPAPSTSVTLTGCAGSCPGELDIEVRNGQGDLQDISGCLPEGTYEVTAMPSLDTASYTWVVDGSVQNSNLNHILVQIPAQGTIPVSAIATIPGCKPALGSVDLTGCEKGTPPGGDGAGGFEIFSCNGLFIAAIVGLLLGGAIGVAGACLNVWWVWVAGIVVGATGAILFGLWLWKCRSKTSCDIMATVRCLLSWLVLVSVGGGLLAWLLAYFFDFLGVACGITSVGVGAGWGATLHLITEAMVAKGCAVETCQLPNSAPEPGQATS